MLEALNILEGYDLHGMGHNSAPYLHAVTEALKLSFADRNKYVGDPKFVPNIPMRELLSKEYAAARRALIDPNHAIAGEPAPGDPRALHGRPAAGERSLRRPAAVADDGRRRSIPTRVLNLTTYLAVVDKDHNMVSVTSSLLSGFGSGMVVDRRRLLHERPHEVFLPRPEQTSIRCSRESACGRRSTRRWR